ncbi:outer membrane protein assembly factor BamD [Alishewanella tabrizica]|uniref:Outer membrane protein assembly factor BamD n=1 Tax=Alishewanella tabrizica TaxID=671278 RepID=A0ABQ2WSK7_9ALTE|nr:outer membrane protein assembly factor BamD [Alishewanella tabrizica]GGW71657.1 outer membrane protein assembly factor BamD [Alishewanella tabrizica]
MKLKFILIILMSITLSACAGKPKPEQVNPSQTAQGQYQQAKDVLDAGLYNRAIELLKAVESRFPFGPLARQVQLDLIYAYHQAGDLPQALASIDRFIRLNPNQPDLDYVYYMRGLTNLKADENAFQEFFGIDRSDRDLSSTRQAFEDFKILLNSYPQSKYAADAKQRMVIIKDQLARHELLVADYYLRRGAFLAAANRGKYVVEFYRDSPLVEQALVIMVESYEKLGLDKLKTDTEQVLRLNFPQNSRFN